MVLNNTIAFNDFGIESPPVSARVLFNNIVSNNNKNFIAAYSYNFDASYNWWGTIDVSGINQTIRDYKYDYNAGKITFIPFLDAPNPQAPPISNFVEPSSSPPISPNDSSSTSNASSTNPEPQPQQNSTKPTSPNQPNTQDQPETTLYQITISILITTIGALIIAIGCILRKRQYHRPQK